MDFGVCHLRNIRTFMVYDFLENFQISLNQSRKVQRYLIFMDKSKFKYHELDFKRCLRFQPTFNTCIAAESTHLLLKYFLKKNPSLTKRWRCCLDMIVFTPPLNMSVLSRKLMLYTCTNNMDNLTTVQCAHRSNREQIHLIVLFVVSGILFIRKNFLVKT